MLQRTRSTRKEKIAEEIRQEVSQIIALELLDPRVEGVSVTHVKMTPDLRLARVYFNVAGNERNIKEVEAGLKSASGVIKSAIADRLVMKFVPNLEFFYDETEELQKKIDLLFQEIEAKKTTKEES